MATPFVPRSARLLEIIGRDKPSLLPLFTRVLAGRAPFMDCIEAQCLDCVGLDKAAVKSCGVSSCPLWNVRPYRDGGQDVHQDSEPGNGSQ